MLASKKFALIPIFKGGNLFVDAVLSLDRYSHLFEDIVISFNGMCAEDYYLFEKIRTERSLKGNYIVFRTLEDLSALEHGLFLVDRISKNSYFKNSSIFLMAHDDRLISKKLEFESFFKSCRLDTVYFPEYHRSTAPSYDIVYEVDSISKTLNSDEFFWKSMSSNIATNMSGLVLPFSVWVRVTNLLREVDCGARFEHLVCIDKQIRFVKWDPRNKVIVGARLDSDGAQLSNRQHRSAAFLYVKSYFLRGTFRPSKILQILYHLLTKYLLYIYSILK